VCPSLRRRSFPPLCFPRPLRGHLPPLGISTRAKALLTTC
jgi:hypothetical protein